jgi:hypothetical protein
MDLDIYNKIKKRLTPLDITYNYYNMKNYIFYNSKGASNLDNDDNIYIDCQPVETTDTENLLKNTKNQTSAFNKNMISWFSNNWSVFVFIIILLVMFGILIGIYKGINNNLDDTTDDCN